MEFLPLNIILFASILAFGQTNDDQLIRICEDEFCELGTPSGYVNTRGDTIIQIGRFYYCYTDTITDYGIVLDKNGVCKAIDKSGNYLYDVKWYDNGPDYPSEGLFRIIIDGKTGYANGKGKIIIEPQFACTNPFKNGKAKVTYECDLVDDGEHKIMKSDSWFYIDKTGHKID